jgi:putative DNA primase/helicase
MVSRAREDERREREARKEAERKERERQKALEAVVKLPTGEHEAELKKLAKRLDVDLEILREEFDVLLGDEAEKIKRGIIEPWDSPVDTRTLLQDITTQFRSYVIVHDEAAATIIPLWICFAWVHQIATHSPILVIQGADSDMAKTLTCKVLALLTPRAYVIAEPTGPSLYRFVDRHHPTLIIDDADRLLPRRPDLTHIINASWTANTPIPRSDANGNVQLYDPFCPKVLSGIDLLAHLATATRTRCITVDLLPKLGHEEVISFRRAGDDENFVILRRKLLRWATDNMAAIKAADPAMPEGFTNRLEENYTLLFAIADLAGGEWPKKVRAAAVKLSREHNEPSMGKRALAIFFNLFIRYGLLLTSKQAEELISAEDDVFANYKNRGRPINMNELAALLRPYKVHPKVIHPRGRPADRGWDAADFAIPFRHYLRKDLPAGCTPVRKPRKKPPK